MYRPDIPLRVMSPRTVTSRVRSLLQVLELSESSISWIKVKTPKSFVAEVNNCHFNVWVQWDKEGGAIQHGWLLGEDSEQDFAEAQFHTVWRSPDGKLQDVTPRADREKRAMFVEDPKRAITLSQHEGRPAILTYDNVRIYRGQLISGVEVIKIMPPSDLLRRHGLMS